MDGALRGLSISRRLASCNNTTRDKALRLLKTWLPSQREISDDEMKKIWKGLFYCVWHADKQAFQVELINRLASFLVTIDHPLSVQYFEVFLMTIRREWSGIDYLRLDKFYLLIRTFLRHLFILLRKNSWDLELSSRLMGVLEERTLLAVDKLQAQGVTYHISEIFLDELKAFLPIRLEILDVFLKPFLSVLVKSPDKVLLNKIKSGICDCLLKNGKKLLELKKAGDYVIGSDKCVDVLGVFALKFGLSTKFFELGSSEECIQGNRKFLFGMHEDFMKLEKDLEASGIEISVPEIKEHEDVTDEVPDLIPVAETDLHSTEVADGSVEKPSKKSKKGKKLSGVTGKKSKTKKSRTSDSSVSENGGPTVKDENGSLGTGNDTESNEEPVDDGNLIDFNETVISNLQKQFEKVAAEVGMDVDGDSSIACNSPAILANGMMSKKRKRAKRKDGQDSNGLGLDTEGDAGNSVTCKSSGKSAKKVRFSMKSNLVWKPHSPLPPQDLRLPPSATPRGSALKQGIPPGPIMETPPTTKRLKKRASSVKKARRGRKTVSPALKRLRKLQSVSV